MAPVSRTRWMYLLMSSLLAMMVSFSAFAQRSDGGIAGDAAPGDKVVVQNTGTGFKREGVADEGGKYRFRSLPLGEYRIIVTRGESEVVLDTKVVLRQGATARAPKAAMRDQAGESATPPATSEPAPASN